MGWKRAPRPWHSCGSTMLRRVLRETLRLYRQADGRLLGAAVAFYGLLSTAPLFVIALHITGLVWDVGAARAALTENLARWMGPEGASTIDHLVSLSSRRMGGRSGSWLGLVVTFYGATRLFSALERSIERIWEVPDEAHENLRARVVAQVRRRGTSFLLVVGVSLVLMILMVLRTVGAFVADHLGSAPWILRAGHATPPMLVSVLVFWVLFTVLPRVRHGAWDSLVGAAVTAGLFSLGTAVVDVYLRARGAGRAFGPAGSLVALLLWANYSAQAFFLGAAFTAAWSRRSTPPVTRT